MKPEVLLKLIHELFIRAITAEEQVDALMVRVGNLEIALASQSNAQGNGQAEMANAGRR